MADLVPMDERIIALAKDLSSLAVQASVEGKVSLANHLYRALDELLESVYEAHEPTWNEVPEENK